MRIGAEIVGKKRMPLLCMSSDQAFRSLFFHASFLLTTAFIYAKTGKTLFWIALAYFGANTCFLSVLLLVLVSSSEGKSEMKKEIAGSNTLPVDNTPYLKRESNPVHEEKESAQKLIQGLRRKRKVVVSPSQLVIKRYSEYKNKFFLTKELEKKFKTWIHKNIVQYEKTSNYMQNQNKWHAKVVTKAEKEEIALFVKNGFIYYDKKNELHTRALFKMMYNYFNAMMPREGSYYKNPMDEFVFDDITTIRVSIFGLLVEDIESLVERKKVFNVYFMEKNTLYDTEGDIALSFLLLLISANSNAGGCLGSLSLRDMSFLK